MSATSTTPGAPRLTGGPGYGRRRAVNRLMEGLSTLAAMLAIAVLALVIVSVVVKAAPAINLDFLTQTPNPTAALFGKASGGIANSIIGSAELIVIASVISIPIGILVAVYTTEFAHQRVAVTIRFALDLLNGVPTIVTGIFVFGVLVIPEHHQSGWAGGIGLAIVELPIVARSAQEVLALVPSSLREAGLALGLRRWRIVLRVILPTARGGLVTGAVLGVARVAGETAPLLLASSIFANQVSTNPSGALANIPVTIFTLSEAPSEASHAQAWAAALVLIVFVLLVSVIARAFNERSRRKLAG